MISIKHIYEVRPRKDHRGVDLRFDYAEDSALQAYNGMCKFSLSTQMLALFFAVAVNPPIAAVLGAVDVTGDVNAVVSHRVTAHFALLFFAFLDDHLSDALLWRCEERQITAKTSLDPKSLGSSRGNSHIALTCAPPSTIRRRWRKFPFHRTSDEIRISWRTARSFLPDLPRLSARCVPSHPPESCSSRRHASVL